VAQVKGLRLAAPEDDGPATSHGPDDRLVSSALSDEVLPAEIYGR
jgi:hypothetical protein